jgi:hypothetical protein
VLGSDKLIKSYRVYRKRRKEHGQVVRRDKNKLYTIVIAQSLIVCRTFVTVILNQSPQGGRDQAVNVHLVHVSNQTEPIKSNSYRRGEPFRLNQGNPRNRSCNLITRGNCSTYIAQYAIYQIVTSLTSR